MDFDHDIDLSAHKTTTRLIIKRALARGWSVTAFKTNKAILLITPQGASKPIKIFSASPPQTSYVAAKIAKDKYITNQILRQSGVDVPDELIIKSNEDINDDVAAFIKKYGSVVLKPLDASHGNGVVVNIESIDQLVQNLKLQQLNHRSSKYIVQEQLSGHDIRIICIDYMFVDAISREPASVIGDGEHTVDQLIAIENQHEDRSTNYKTRLNVIPMNVVTQYLSDADLAQVPAKGIKVQVLGISNIGVGGVIKNIKTQIPDFIIKTAEEVAQTLELAVCGIDFMVGQLPTASSTIEQINPKIIEVNECPMLSMYEDLDSEEQYEIIDKYLDYIVTK